MEIISREDANAQGLKQYYTGIVCKQGHDSSRNTKSARCVQCGREAVRSWKTRNREHINQYKREYYANNQEAYAEYNRQYHKRTDYYNNRYASDILFRLRHLCRTIPSRLARSFDTASSGKVPYTALELKTHLEQQFQVGMTWDNYGEWHIDHIKPVSAFISEGITDISIINELTNLQPLWAVDNITKGAKHG